jgi:hypothetical protein
MVLANPTYNTFYMALNYSTLSYAFLLKRSSLRNVLLYVLCAANWKHMDCCMCAIYKGGKIGCLILPARLGKPQRGSALAGEALVGALRLENHFLKSARIEPKLFLLFAYNIY